MSSSDFADSGPGGRGLVQLGGSIQTIGGRRAYYLDGNQDGNTAYVTNIPSTIGPLTYCFWYRPISVTNPWTTLISSRKVSDGTNTNAMGLLMPTGQEIKILWPGVEYTVSTGFNVTLNEWCHVALTVDITSNTAKLYKNGVLVYTRTPSPAYSAVPLENIYIGTDPVYDPSNHRDAHGYLDDVAIYSTVLTQSEIQSIMNNGYIGAPSDKSSNLIGFYGFGDAIATVPGAPTAVSAVAGNGQATVSWTAPASNGGATISSYTVTSSPGGFTATTANGSTTTATVTGLTNGTAYTFTVRATNFAGNSVASAASAAVTPIVPPTYTFTSYTGANSWWQSAAFNSDNSIIYAVNAVGPTGQKIYKSTDGGTNWSLITAPISYIKSICCSSSGQIVYISVGNVNNYVYKSTDYGVNWSQLNNSGPRATNSGQMDCSSDGSVVCVPYYNGQVWLSSDAGASWSAMNSPSGRWEKATIYNNDSTIAVIRRDSPAIYISEKTNGVWSNFTATSTGVDGNKAVRIVGAKTANILYFTNESAVYKSTNKGVSWTGMSVPNASMIGIGCSADGTIIAAGSVIAANNSIYISTNSGTSWTLYQPSGSPGGYYDLNVSPNGNKILAYAYAAAPLFIGTAPVTTPTTPSTAEAAIAVGTTGSSGALQTYIAASSATPKALALEVRAAIKNISDATAKAAAKVDYIAAIRAKEPTLKIAVPQTDFSSYIATFSNVPTAISSAAKPIDVIIPSASNIIDITTVSVDETKYTAIEMPLNTTMTVQDNGSTVGTLNYNGSVYTDGNSNTYSVGNSIIFGTKKVTILGQGSALVEITNTYKSIEINFNVEISANGTLEILGYQPSAPSNLVIASTLLPVDALYDEAAGIALIEFWEPDDLDDIMAQLASTQTLDGVEGYKITAKKLVLGLQNCLIGELDAKSAEPFNAAPKYGTAGVQNGNRVMTGFGRLALMAYAHYIMGHVQATAAITNDTDFMKGMLSLNSDLLTSYKYANIGNYDGSAAPWTTIGDASDANIAVRLVKMLIDNNPTTSLVSNGAATTVANIVKQVIGQDATRATDEDNNKYSPENHGLLRFYPNDVIYVSINLTTPSVTVGTGQLVSGPTMEGLYANATGNKKYTIKLTLGPKI